MKGRGWSHLVCYYGPTGCSGICCNNNASIVKTAYDCCTGTRSFRKRYALRMESSISVVVGKVEAWHHSVVRGRVESEGMELFD